MKKFCNRMSENILNLDIYGTKPQFNINKQDNFKTNFGSFLTISSILTTILALSYFSLQLFNVANPKLVTSVKNIFNPSQVLLNNSNYGFSFGLQNPFSYDQFIDESYYRAEAFHMTGKRITNGTTSYFNWTTNQLKLELCNIQKFPTNYHHLFKSLPFGNLYCLKNTAFSLFGTFLNEEYQYIMIKLYECRNNTYLAGSGFYSSVQNSISSISTKNENSQNMNLSINNFNNSNNISDLSKNEKYLLCKPKEAIDEMLAGAFFDLAHTDLTIDPSNYTNPNQLYSGDSYTTVSNKFFKEMHHYINIINFETDKGWLISDIERNVFLKTDYIKEMTDFRKSENFLSYTIKLSTKVETYSRSYAKIQNVAAEAGGFLKMISMICIISSFYYNKSKFYQVIGEEIMTEMDSKADKKSNSDYFFEGSQMKFDLQSNNNFKNLNNVFYKNQGTSSNPKPKTGDFFYNDKYHKDEYEKKFNIQEIYSNFSKYENNQTPPTVTKHNNYFNDTTINDQKNANSNLTQIMEPNNAKETPEKNSENLHSLNENESPGKNSAKNINIKNKFTAKRFTKSKSRANEKTANSQTCGRPDANVSNFTIKPRKKTKRIKLSISFCESFRYLFCYMLQTKNKNFKKLNLIRRKVDDLLDILNVFRYFNDFERIKNLILDNEQYKLFNLPYFYELNFSDPKLLSQSTFIGERIKKTQEFNTTVLYNVVANKEDIMSKKLTEMINC